MELYKKLNIDEKVFQNIVEKLKRVPNDFETYLFSAMHSEHCGYMHSKKYLKNFYTNKSFEDENAGCIQIKNYNLFFKMESHNHPCAIEPYQGSMTGVGGIIRDIISLGANPVCLLNSLKFGKIKYNKTKYYLSEVTRGISTYGNSVGIPTISGETIFDERFLDIPIVNVLALGLVKNDEIMLSKAKEDALIILLGSKTGIDGLDGASFASKILDKNSSRTSVQIGDPYTKKKLIEAVLEINKLNTTIACQDLGASGILSSTSELCYKGNCGAELYLDKVHCQFENITPIQMMLSESQERMAFVIKKEGLRDFKKIAENYELEYSIIGKTIKGNFYKVFYKNELLADIPLNVLCEPYLFDLKRYEEKTITKIDTIKSLKETFLDLINDENFVSKKYIYSQFDEEVQGRTAFSQKENAIGIQYLKETNSFIAIAAKTTVDLSAKEAIKNSFLYLYRKLVSFGFEPKGITNCLNFANPNRKIVQTDFLDTVDELKKLSWEFKIPVVSGNVSFYNENETAYIPPCATIAMLGCAEDKKNIIKPQIFENNYIYYFGEMENNSNDFDYETKLKEIIFSLHKRNLITAVKSVGKFGIIGTLLKNSLFYNIGFKIKANNDLYFKKYPSGYILISENEISNELDKNSFPYSYLGRYFGDKIKFEDLEFDLSQINQIYQNKLYSEMEK